jgi:hypothetical protein
MNGFVFYLSCASFMRNILVALLLIAILVVAGSYIFIPSVIAVSSVRLVKTTAGNVNTSLHDTAAWKRWWPGKKDFEVDGYDYNLKTALSDGAEIEMQSEDRRYETKISILPYSNDTVALQWQTSFRTGLFPITRLVRYKEAVDLKKSIDSVLNALGNFSASTKNIYGFDIVRTTFTDTILAATRFSGVEYPSVPLIYAAVDKLKEKIAAGGAKEKDFPMLHVSQVDGKYETMIAICVDHEVANDDFLFTSRMVPMKDRFLVTGVTGGPWNISQAHKAVEQYMQDRFLTQPAIPFEILITDRSREKDTAKWKTRICYPSM